VLGTYGKEHWEVASSGSEKAAQEKSPPVPEEVQKHL